MSWKSDLKGYITSIEDKSNKRNVQIHCADSKKRATAQNLITTHLNELGIWGYEGMASGANTGKNFTMQFNTREAAGNAYNKLMSVMNDSSIEHTPPDPYTKKEKEEQAATEQALAEQDLLMQLQQSGSGDNTTLIIIIAAVLIVVVAGVVVWKGKK